MSIVAFSAVMMNAQGESQNILSPEEKIQWFDGYYKALIDEVVSGRDINWAWIHRSGFFEELYREIPNEQKRQLAQDHEAIASEAVSHAISRGIGIQGLETLANEIDLTACRIVPEQCTEVWDRISTKHDVKIAELMKNAGKEDRFFYPHLYRKQ